MDRIVHELVLTNTSDEKVNAFKVLQNVCKRWYPEQPNYFWHERR